MPRSDLLLRLLALGIAVGLFLVVVGDRRVSVSYALPLAPTYRAGVTPAQALPAEVTLSISGPWARVRMVDPTAVGPITVDLTQDGPGTHAWFIRPEAIRLPRGVRVDSIHPAQGTVELRRDAH